MLSLVKKISADAKAFPTGVKLIVLVLFLRSLGWGFVDPFYSIFVNGFSDNYAGVGSLISLMNLSSLLAIIPLIRLAGKMKDTVIMRDGEVLYLFAITFYLLAAFTGRLSFLILAFIFNGIAFPFMIVGAETYIRKYAHSTTETKSFAFYTAIHYLGWIIGMLIGAFTVQYYGLKLMFLFILPSSIVGFAILKRIPEKIGFKSMIWGVKKYLHNGHDFKVMADTVRNMDKRSAFCLLLSFFDGVIIMFSFIFIPLLAISLNLGLRSVALLMAVMYLPFIFSFFISEVTDRLKRMDVIAIGLFIGGLSFVLMSFIVHELWIAVLATMKSVSLAIIRPTYNGVLTRLTPRKMLGEMTGINNVAMRLGFIVGPVASGFIADRYSIQVAFFAIAVFAFTLAAITLSFRSYESIVQDDDKLKQINV